MADFPVAASFPDVPPDPPPEDGPNDYFDYWSLDSHIVHAYSLRDNSQLNDLAVPPPSSPGWVYDTTLDAARGLVPAGDGSTDADVNPQLRIIDPTDTGTVTFVWDLYLPSNWSTETGFVIPNKSFQTTHDVGSATGLWMETRLYPRTNQGTPLPQMSIDWRNYATGSGYLLGPGVSKSASPNGNDSDTIQPLLARFLTASEKWVRYVEHIELNALVTGGHTYDLWYLWVMDETRDAVQLYNAIGIEHPTDGVKGFVFEYDASLPRAIGTIDKYVYNRNFLMFREFDLSIDIPVLFQKPIAA